MVLKQDEEGQKKWGKVLKRTIPLYFCYLLVFFIANEEMSSHGWLEHSPSPACCSLHYSLKLNQSDFGLVIFTLILELFSVPGGSW